MLGAIALVGAATASAGAPTNGLTRASGAQAQGVIKAVNSRSGTQRPSACFDVWVTKSNSNWATWTYSKKAYSMASCAMTDGYMEFYVKSGSRWKWAGRYSGVSAPRCFFSINPPFTVQQQLGCA